MKSEGERGGVSVASSDSSTGGLFSERFSLWLKSLIKCVKHYPEDYPSKEKSVLRFEKK